MHFVNQGLRPNSFLAGENDVHILMIVASLKKNVLVNNYGYYMVPLPPQTTDLLM